ncbi:hypothetical protein GCM10023075_68280 [Streptosporangium album]
MDTDAARSPPRPPPNSTNYPYPPAYRDIDPMSTNHRLAPHSLGAECDDGVQPALRAGATPKNTPTAADTPNASAARSRLAERMKTRSPAYTPPWLHDHPWVMR